MMQSPKIKVAVVGVGFFGERHVKTYSELQNVQLVAVVDSDIQRAREIAQKYGCEPFADAASLAGKIDAASIATPTKAHHPTAKMLLSEGVDLLIEKPIASTLQEADELNRLAQEKGRIVAVGHIERFNPALLQLKEHLSLPSPAGTGVAWPSPPRFIECHRMGPFLDRAANVSVVLDLMIHDIDIVLSLVSSELLNVHATGVSVVSPEVDVAHAWLFFADGAVANLMASRVSDDRIRTIRIFQKQAYLFLDYLQRELTVYSRRDTQEKHSPATPEKYTFDKGDPLKSQLCAFIEAVRRRETPIVSGKAGREALSIALQIEGQIKTASDFK